MGKILEAALEYAKAGFAVIPVKRSDKEPYTKNGSHDGSTDPDQIRKWWKRWPNANVAIVCGKISGYLFVVDVDIKDGKHGDFMIASWQAQHGDFPETVQQRTGSGGTHLFFRCEAIAEYKNVVDAIPGVDIRGEWTYVVVAPSVYEDGRTYSWVNEVDILMTDEIATANDSVIELLALNPQGGRSKSKGATTKVKNVKKGARNDTIFKYASAQRRYDVPLDFTMQMAKMLNASWPNPLLEREVEKTVRGVYERYEPGEATIYGDSSEIETDEEIQVHTLDQFEEKEVEWLIPGYIPKEQITIMCGTGGTGKTSIWISIVAALSSGKKTIFNWDLPDSFVKNRNGMKIMIFSGEDTVEHVLLGRLRKQGADLTKISTISLDEDSFEKIVLGSKNLEKIIEKERPALCLFDPLQSFINSKADMSKRNDMRKVMRPLIEWGKKYGTTFLIVMHTNKMQNVWGRSRMADSADLWDIARSVLMVGETSDPDIKYISHEKCNYAKTGKTIIFRNANGQPEGLRWSDDKDREFVIAATKSRKSERNSETTEEAMALILEKLDEAGKPVAVKELTDTLLAYDFKEWTIRSAKTRLAKAEEISVYKDSMLNWMVKKLKKS